MIKEFSTMVFSILVCRLPFANRFFVRRKRRELIAEQAIGYLQQNIAFCNHICIFIRNQLNKEAKHIPKMLPVTHG